MNARDRSYAVRRAISPGARVRLTEDTYYGGSLAAGTAGTLISFSNAGFRGIEAAIQLDDGRHINISAGLIEAA